MVDNTLRTAIAQAIRGADPAPIGDGIQYEAMVFPLEAADAVLAVLADLPDDVIERAARWMYDEYTALMPDAWERDEFGREEWRVDARNVLRAALGINNYKEKSK